MFPVPLFRSFACGFTGGLMGGAVYWLLLSYADPGGLDFAWLRILAVSLSFGAVEVWRVARKRKQDRGQFGMETAWRGLSNLRRDSEPSRSPAARQSR